MNKKKNIDRLFQEKFKDFEAIPNDKVWENIEARLQSKEKKRRIIPIWWQLGGVAAAILLLFATKNLFFSQDPDFNNPILKTSSNTKQNSNIDTSSTSEIKDNSTVVSNTPKLNNLPKASDDITNDALNKDNKTNSNKLYNTKTSDEIIVKNSSTEKFKNLSSPVNKSAEKKNTITKVASTSVNNISEYKNKSGATKIKSKEEVKHLINSTTKSKEAIAKTDNSNSDKEESLTNEEINKLQEGQDIEEAIAEANELDEKEKKIRRWGISPNVAPVYFNSLGNGSSIDPQFIDNNRQSDISMSYGVKGTYALNNRLKITAGINRVNFNSTTTDVIGILDNSFSSINSSASKLENVTLNTSVNDASLMVMSRTRINQNTLSEVVRTLPTGNLEQRFGFIEIPLELEYRLIDKKIGVNLSSGFSTFLLNENDIFADVNGESTLIGEANNLNETSFSANFGVGIDYSITEKININLEPKFKYQLNTFNNTSGDFRPFFIGVYTGLNFKF